MPDEIEEDYEMTAWINSVEFRIGRLKLGIMVDGAVGVGALVLAAVGFKAITNLATALNQLGQVTNGIASVVMPQPTQTAPVASTPKGVVIDETPIPKDNVVATPAAGPESEASDTVKELLKQDPVSPGEMLRGEQLPQPLIIPDTLEG